MHEKRGRKQCGRLQGKRGDERRPPQWAEKAGSIDEENIAHDKDHDGDQRLGPEEGWVSGLAGDAQRDKDSVA